MAARPTDNRPLTAKCRFDPTVQNHPPDVKCRVFALGLYLSIPSQLDWDIELSGFEPTAVPSDLKASISRYQGRNELLGRLVGDRWTIWRSGGGHVLP